MSINIRFPNITAKTEAGQIEQIKSYLYQLVQQLNWVLATLESGTSAATAAEDATQQAIDTLKVTGG